MKRITIILLFVMVQGCKKDNEPVFCWKCLTNEVIYDSDTRVPRYYKDSVVKCDYSAADADAYEVSRTWKGVVVNSQGQPTGDTSFAKSECYKL